jgi:hypothetical protein
LAIGKLLHRNRSGKIGLHLLSIILANVARKAEDIRHDFSLDKLLVAHRAEFDSYIDQHEDQHEDECLLGTRTELLRKITE